MKMLRTLRYSVLILAAAVVLWPAGRACGIGFVLGQTREELKLKYDVLVHDHGTGRVTIVFTLADEGRLEPLDAVQLVIPAQEKNDHGGRWMDLVVSIEMTRIDGGKINGGKRVGRIHIRKELAERAEIRLNTHTMDGKLDPLTRLHHVIPVKKFMNDAPKPAAKPAAVPSPKPAAPPATERRED